MNKGIVLITGLGVIIFALLAVLILVPSGEKVEPRSPKLHTTTMILTSSAFEHNGMIPKKFTCDGSTELTAGGGNINPELLIQNVPAEAKSLALILDDPDAPGGTFTHWTVWNIAASREASLAPEGRDPFVVIKEGSKPPGSVEGKTDFGRVGYGGPCPPSGTHRYFFKLYALDTLLNLPQGAPRRELEAAMEQHILAHTELMGTYERRRFP